MMKVGDKFNRVDGPITREQIKEYASASGDSNPIHVNEKKKKKNGGLNGVIAHGMLFFGFVNHLVSDLAIHNKGKVLATGCEMRGSVRPGDWVVTNAEVKAINGKVVELEIIQDSKMPLKLEKDGKVIKTFEGQERGWVKDKEVAGIKTENTPEGVLTYRLWLAIKAKAKIELP